jgi:hypothetical protein
MIHSFLLIGQSNMAGRGIPSEVEPIQNKDILMLRNGRWWPMYVPVNPDRVTAGINLAESFADQYARDHGVQVGLIPCADGGTHISQWRCGGALFDHACMMAKLADRSATIAGILWHQGESDCTAERYPLYEEKLTDIVNGFRKVPYLANVPFLVGGLGDFLPKYAPNLANYVHINDALKSVAAKLDNMGYVNAEGLTANPDNLHFSARALREFGLRYYDVFRTLENKEQVFEEKPDWDFVVRGEMEAL